MPDYFTVKVSDQTFEISKEFEDTLRTFLVHLELQTEGKNG